MSRLGPAVAAILCVLSLGAPAAAQDIDPALKADIDRLMELTGALAQSARTATALANQTLDNMQRLQPNVPPRAVAIMKEVLATEIGQAFDSAAIRDVMTRIFASNFTKAEVGELLTFYSTDLGRKLLKVGPVLTEQGAAAGQQWAVANMPRILGIVQQRLRDEKLIP